MAFFTRKPPISLVNPSYEKRVYSINIKRDLDEKNLESKKSVKMFQNKENSVVSSKSKKMFNNNLSIQNSKKPISLSSLRELENEEYNLLKR